MITEKLFLTPRAFHYPTEPVTFYFSLTDNPKNHYTYLKSSTLFPTDIHSIFPTLENNQTLYTSFDRETEDSTALPIDFNDPAHFNLVKRYYNDKIEFYLRKNNLITDFNRYANTYQAWVHSPNASPRKDCKQYDRFSVKITHDHFNNNPQIVLSYDRPALIYNTSVAKILTPPEDFDPLSTNNAPQPTTELFNRVLYRYTTNEYKRIKIAKYKSIATQDNFDSENAFPIMNRKLADFLHIDTPLIEELSEEDNSQYISSSKTKNRYKTYYDKINAFYRSFLDRDEFREIIPISTDGFSWVNKMQVGQTNSSSKDLVFAHGITNYNPQRGVNNGPFKATQYSNIQLVCFYPQKDKKEAADLLCYIKNGYKNLYAGIKKYTGKDVVYPAQDLHLQFTNTFNPIPEIKQHLHNLTLSGKLNTETKYVVIYLTPISKNTSNRQVKEIYYQVKEQLLTYGIVSQCIETQKMLAVLHSDNTRTDKKGNPLKNFAYTLQNMAIAINAKLGGVPWCINTEKQNELIVGVGAYKNVQTQVQYLGSAFSFDNTGSFNSFESFQKDELAELAGSIQNAVINFAKINGRPERLIIHYYKQISLKKEYPLIEQALNSLGLDIPIYIVTVFKTESEDYVLFDGGDDKYFDLMPYSGKYINLGNQTYLLCNNTRYENAVFNPWIEGFPFPIKIKIECPTEPSQQIDTTIITKLIDQVYQFSRIYWKSVKQQNLPVTIKYPEMVAQMAPHFTAGAIPENNDNLWFL